MGRTPLLIMALASAVLGGAWWTQARASAHAPRAAADAPAPPVPSPTRGIDEYGAIPFEDEKARLDNFAIELMNDPASKGHITCYGSRVGRAGEARRRCARAKRYLSGYRGIPAAQVVTVDGGYREDLTVTLWIVPPGASSPPPSPTVEPREVRFIKEKKRRRARRP